MGLFGIKSIFKPEVLDAINADNKTIGKIESKEAFTGKDGNDGIASSKSKDDDYKVSTEGMRSSNAYFNLGLAAREGIEKKAKAKGYESYSDMRSKKKESRGNKKSYKTELRGIKKSYKKAK